MMTQFDMIFSTKRVAPTKMIKIYQIREHRVPNFKHLKTPIGFSIKTRKNISTIILHPIR